jgi:hypothetical protein
MSSVDRFLARSARKTALDNLMLAKRRCLA